MTKRKREDLEATAGDGHDEKRVCEGSADDASSHGYAVGARVMVFGKYAASIRYLAPTDGIAGVELDRAVGNCDGTFQSQRLFSCKPHRGMVVRLEQLQVFSPQEAAACTIQAVWRRRRCLRAFQTLVLTSSWNVLDNHNEQLNLKRAELTRGASDTLLALAQQRRDAHPPLARAVSSLPASYTGPTVPLPLTLPSVLSLLDAFKRSETLHASFVLPILDRAIALFASESTVQHIRLPSTEHKLTIVGDLHGQLQDLFCIFLANGLPSHANMYLFNGDFVDRGVYGAEVVLTLLSFKLLYPNAVFLNRGNHESRNQNGWMGFEEEILLKYKSDDVKAQATTILERFQTCFDALPLAAVVLDKIFVVHGGLFGQPRVTIADLDAIPRRREPPLHSQHPQDKLFEELMWSDPRQIRGRQPSLRGAGVEFGDDVTVEFCATNKVALVIRSHECVPEGYAIQHGGRLITLFSASRYCGTQLNQGAYLTLGADCKPEIQQFMAPALEQYAKKAVLFAVASSSSSPELDDEGALQIEAKQASLEGDLLRMIAERICDHKAELFLYCTQHEATDAPGHVSRLAWADALKTVLGLDVPFLLYQPKLTETEVDGRINYSRFLSRYRIENPAVDASGWQESIISTICKKLYLAMGAGSIEHAFRIFDADANGTIEYDEFMATLKGMDTGLSEQQMFELMRTADTNDDGRLDFKEFVQRFEVIFTDVRSRKDDTPSSTPVSARHGQLVRRSSFETESETTFDVDPDTMVALVQIGKAFFQLDGTLLSSFERFDTNHDGVLQAHELHQALQQLGLDFADELFHKVWRAIDTDGGNTVDYKEFLAAFRVQDNRPPASALTWQQSILQQVSNVLYQHRIHFRSAFRLFDQDKSGSISRDEFRAGISTFNAILDRPLSDDQVDALLAHLDGDGDGNISYNEFLEGFQVVSIE
ncbi:hypothetical protein SPRG_12473 [Saprolegnia parasitica CBS 223.65]|uniref:Serine/threonine-protein phosphatase n=1 Tax=Saprolegnia parasitica (strain CBS 223.65) TaxID=695850 RepID=A0A067BSJ9_SAPPC|nr:hypothetical protein SPRG_12473 [Saprolegnia parasitica CBS 223.65]KDO21509.1 hypothetical protein SPRG_12473 [Saprolegnia parasitica CBS 223.65]|eukprot:XP_012207776.1 hypothetical protein SPRG_12473 [Saprolegnia parasitica CBS 223.65]